MTTQNKPINDYTNEELEKLELQLWRARHEAQVRLEQATTDLGTVTQLLAQRNGADTTDDSAG
jgi:hypothetical protein